MLASYEHLLSLATTPTRFRGIQNRILHFDRHELSFDALSPQNFIPDTPDLVRSRVGNKLEETTEIEQKLISVHE